MYRLVFENLPPPRPPLPGPATRLLIGRDPACALRLTEPGVSDRHAAIEPRADGWYIRDLGSANGVRVNDQLVTDHRLASGDRLELGAVRLRFEIVHAAGLHRRWSPLQWAAAAIIAGTTLGPLAVIAWVLSQPRSRHMRVHTTVKLDEPAPPVAVPAPVIPTTPPPPLAPIPTPPRPAAPAAPAVLTRKLRVVRLEPTGDTLRIIARAQVETRTLDVQAVTVTVEPFIVDASGRTVSAGAPVLVAIPAWENFESKTLVARLASPAARYAGFVVRTYYRDELQDVAAQPVALLTLIAR